MGQLIHNYSYEETKLIYIYIGRLEWSIGMVHGTVIAVLHNV